MADSEASPASIPAPVLLGLPETASRHDVEDAFDRLRSHVEQRLRESSDAAFREAREREIAGIEALRRAWASTGPAADAPHRPRVRRARPWLIAWATLATLVAAALGGMRLIRPPSAPPVDAPPPMAVVVVTADPPSAELLVTTGDDDHVLLRGPADGTPRPLDPGTHRLAVRHPDCPDDWTQTVAFAAGEQRTYAPTICQGNGRLVVRSNVSGDRVRIDGVDVGSTGAEAHALRVGAHEVRVEKEGFAPWVGTVRVERDAEITLNAELASAGPPAPAGQAPRPAAVPPAPVAMPRPPEAASTSPDDAGGMLKREATGRPLPARTGRGGSKSWHDAVKQDLVSQFDRNGSRSLDTPAEVEAIPCETWRNIEQSYETGGLAVEMTHLYGFDGSEAPANTLGITTAVRGYAFERMKACGLKARR